MTQKKKPETIIRYRSSETGKFVPKPFADRHPATTERQHIRKPETNRNSTKRT